MSRDPDHASFRDDLSAGWDLLPLTYRPNSTFLTTPITKIWEAVQNVQMYKCIHIYLEFTEHISILHKLYVISLICA